MYRWYPSSIALTSLAFNARHRPPRDLRVSHIIPELHYKKNFINSSKYKNDDSHLIKCNIVNKILLLLYQDIVRLFDIAIYSPSNAHVQQLVFGDIVHKRKPNAVNVQHDFLINHFEITNQLTILGDL